MRAARCWAVAGATVLLGLGGCGGAASGTAGPPLAGAAAVGSARADTSLIDRLAAWLDGGDCPTAAEDGGCCRTDRKVAASDPPVVTVEAHHYCYRTLAAITCYEAPDPQASASRLVR